MGDDRPPTRAGWQMMVVDKEGEDSLKKDLSRPCLLDSHETGTWKEPAR